MQRTKIMKNASEAAMGTLSNIGGWLCLFFLVAMLLKAIGDHPRISIVAFFTLCFAIRFGEKLGYFGGHDDSKG